MKLYKIKELKSIIFDKKLCDMVSLGEDLYLTVYKDTDYLVGFHIIEIENYYYKCHLYKKNANKIKCVYSSILDTKNDINGDFNKLKTNVINRYKKEIENLKQEIILEEKEKEWSKL